MNAQELLEVLQDMESEGVSLDDVPVRLAHQPRWAFEYAAQEAVFINNEKPLLVIAEGSQLGYLPQEIADEIGW